MHSNEQHIAAVMIYANDWRQGLAWYHQAFPDATIVDVAEYDFQYLKLGNIDIEIVRADEKVSPGAAGTVVYWQTEDFDNRLSFLQGLGATLYRGPKVIEHRVRMCQLKDPFGNLMGIRENPK